ncbi:hypothetical protein EYF80_060418 [Liparis tanakae]|uniref:Uncharacterized protein n=1 Tax=Liparis tanakae TaxID=230148 RepID=A0A4Z2ELX0_9TELE|nr:hypothetical protein EYF80_060418 [Liparis tanakae]
MPNVAAKPNAMLTVRKVPWEPRLSTSCATAPQPNIWREEGATLQRNHLEPLRGNVSTDNNQPPPGGVMHAPLCHALRTHHQNTSAQALGQGLAERRVLDLKAPRQFLQRVSQVSHDAVILRVSGGRLCGLTSNASQCGCASAFRGLPPDPSLWTGCHSSAHLHPSLNSGAPTTLLSRLSLSRGQPVTRNKAMALHVYSRR